MAVTELIIMLQLTKEGAMVIIEQSPLSNGAHRNQSGNFRTIPEGWLPVHSSIEEEAKSYLPFIVIDEIKAGYIMAVSQGEIPEPEPEPEPEPQASDTEVLNTLLGVETEDTNG